MTQAVSEPTYWGTESSTMSYDGFGALVLHTRIPTIGNTSTDEFKVDGFGNVVRHDMNRGFSDGRSATVNSFSAGRMTQAIDDTLSSVTDPENDSAWPLIKTYAQMYTMSDSVGNQTQTNQSVSTWNGVAYQTATSGQSWLRNYYNGADQLKMSERYAYFHPQQHDLSTDDAAGIFLATRWAAAWRSGTQRDSSCTYGDGAQWTDQCVQSIDRFIWDGADLVTELREYGGWDFPAYLNYNGSSGMVQYTNAPGVLGQDVPLLVHGGLGGFVPWPTWHGTFEDGTFADSTSMSSYHWPARTNGLYFSPDERITPTDPTIWMGSLIDGKADANGLLYDRNRYYSPESGQFTQMDPIGLGGGMNLYGYAAGDPVNSSDPFGLWPDSSKQGPDLR